MSLFTSAFETGLNTGPSSSYLANQPKIKSHKRKRPTSHADSSKDDQIRATQRNLEKLMGKVERGDVGSQKDGSEMMGVQIQKKKRKTARADKGKENGQRHGLGKDGLQSGKKQKSKHNEIQQPVKHPAQKHSNKSQGGSGKQKDIQQTIASVPPPTTSDSTVEEGLTFMQKGMRAKLEGARFRWINEQLYSTPSTEALAMMKKDPKIFADYHMTHRALTSAWPSPPLPYIVDLISPLPPRTFIVDLGCGDAGLAKALVPQGKVVLSYDLVGDDEVSGEVKSKEPRDEQGQGGWVVEADFLERVPLPGRPGGTSAKVSIEKDASTRKKKRNGKLQSSGSEMVDVVVCCLSLMGVNWVGGIYEACRILRQGGTFHVAEVTSRFISTDAFITKIESFGFKLENQESPSTHFTLYRFTKTTDVPDGPARGQEGWDERVKEGNGILRGCVYKKR